MPFFSNNSSSPSKNSISHNSSLPSSQFPAGSKKRKRDGNAEGEVGVKGEVVGGFKRGEEREGELSRKCVKEEEVEESIWGSSSGESEWDSEDEVPLAKLVKARLPTPNSAQQPQHGPMRGDYRTGMSGGSMRGASSGMVPRYGEVDVVPRVEGRAWMGMIQGGSAGLSYPSYWGGFHGIGAGAQVQNGEPRNSV